MKKILLFASLLMFFVACSSEPKFELEVNINNNSSLMNKRLVVTQNIDGIFVYADTVKIKTENLKLNLPYRGPALLNVSIPESNVGDIMMASEEGIIWLNIEGTKPSFGGTPLNDRLQAFNQGTDSVSLLFQQWDKDYELLQQTQPVASQVEEEFRQRRRQLLKENTDRIIAFTKENIDNPIGEYYFLTNYITYPLERKIEVGAFATEKLKKEIGIQ